MLGRPPMFAAPVDVTLRMEEVLLDRLKQEAEEVGASVSSRIRRIAEDHFNDKTALVPFLVE